MEPGHFAWSGFLAAPVRIDPRDDQAHRQGN